VTGLFIDNYTIESHSTNTKLLQHAIRPGPSDELTDGLPTATHCVEETVIRNDFGKKCGT